MATANDGRKRTVFPQRKVCVIGPCGSKIAVVRADLGAGGMPGMSVFASLWASMVLPRFPTMDPNGC